MDKKKVSEKAISDLLFMFLLFVFTLAIIPWEIRKVSFGIMASFIANGMLSYIMIVNSTRNRAYSLEAMHWIFYYFFFFFAALIQYMKGVFPWGLYPTDEEIINTNVMIFLWGMCFATGSMLSPNKRRNEKYIESYKPDVIIVCCFIAIVITLFTVKKVGFTNLFAKSTSKLFTDYSPLEMLRINSFRSFVTFNAAICVQNYKRTGHGCIWLVISFVCVLIYCFPTGISRFNAAAIYIGLLILMIPRLGKEKMFLYIFIFSFVIIFPFMNAFRNNSFNDVDIYIAFKNVFRNIQDDYTAGDYDAYSMVIQTIRYIREVGVAWGKQFLGNLLFFVPREFWYNKPVGSGYTIMAALGRQFKNVSEPLPAEFYFNFGIFGIIIGGFMCAYVIKRIDFAYWNNYNSEKKRFLDLFYPFMIALFFFMMRGDFLSTFSYFMAFYVVAKIMYILSSNMNLTEEK